MAEEAKAEDKGSKKKLLARVRDRYKIMESADRENREAAMQDMKFAFVPDEQWTQALSAKDLRARGNRPKRQFNKIRPTVKRVINEMRKNRPGGKVRGTEDSDRATAETFEGLIRNVWNVSDGDTVVDYAGEYQVAGGMGAWRIETRYSSDTAFEQDVFVTPFKNPFCLYADPACADPIKRDAEDWIVTDKITKKAYEARWPKAEVVEFESDEQFDDEGEWAEDESVRICEYWYKEPVTKTICQLSTGEVVEKGSYEALPEGVTVKQERQVRSHKIVMCIASGDSILEGPTDWAGSQFPFVQIFGEWFVIDGKPIWYGLTRHARDPQISYNYIRSSIEETIALTPKAKFMVTPAQAQGHEDKWKEADSKNFPFMLYNPDPKAPGPPSQLPGAQVPVALIQESQIASEEIKATTGIYDASLGNQTNETSGRAINARQQQGELATFNYSDNMGKGIRRTWELLVDLIPKVYDTERSVRILGVDLAEKFVKLNSIDPSTGQPINDLSKGKYDVTVTTGPSFSTQRQEASETYMGLVQAQPELMQVAGDLIFKSMDLPYAEQMAERMQAMLPPQIQEVINRDKKVPPEIEAAMRQVQMMQEQVQQHGQLVQAAEAELNEKAGANAKEEARIQGLLSDMEIRQAKFDASVDTAMAQIKMAEAQLLAHQTQQGVDEKTTEVTNDRAALSSQVDSAVADLQSRVADFMANAQGVIQQMGVPNVIVPPKPVVTRIRKDRQTGDFIPEYASNG